jgi:enoyl-[acyl-carrier protein] reductase I
MDWSRPPLAGKIAVVTGVANKRSIAWGIAQAMRSAGADVIMTYQGERVKDEVAGLAKSIGASFWDRPFDVTDGELMASFFRATKAIDVFVHAIAFAPREALDGRYVDTPVEAFQTALTVSAYSLVECARQAEPAMLARGGGSIVTLTFDGSARVYPNYNVMGVAKAALESSVRYLANDLGPSGIRVNANSAGPVQTVSARGVHGFSVLHKHAAKFAPMRRNTEPGAIGDMAVFLSTEGSRDVTGQVIKVDCGYDILGATVEFAGESPS